MGCSCSRGTTGIEPPPPNIFLPHYTLAALNSRDMFGPFLKLHSHNPDTGSHELTALVVCSEAAQQRLLQSDVPTVTWWDSAGDDPRAFELRFSDTGAEAATQIRQQRPQPQQGQQDQPQQQLLAPEPRTARGELLYSWRDWRFWRFRIDTTCGASAKQLQYNVSLLVPEQVFTVAVPSRYEPWHWAFHSCNGVDNPDNGVKTGGVQPLWTDLLKQHAERPFHAIVGGGDQLYNDGVFDGPLLQGWDHTLSESETAAKIALPYTDAMRTEVEEFYFSHYCSHFSQPVLCTALASIPSINIWDDHDIFDGWGSYPERMQRAPVFKGIFAAAELFFYLFQLHSTPQKAQLDGYWCGASSITCFGGSTAVVLPDSRTFRTINQICPPDFYDELRMRLMALPKDVSHVIYVAAIPVLWPKLNVSKLLQRLSDKITRDKTVNEVLGLTGILRRLQMRFGAIEFIDDLLDHWDSETHRAERDRLLTMMMEMSASCGFRVTFLSGDVHCGGYAVCHGRSADIAADKDSIAESYMPDPDTLSRDPRFMTQVVSSAITNVPPPSYVLEAIEEEGEDAKLLPQDCVMRMRVPGQHFHWGFEDRDDLLVGERNWCDVTYPDGLAGPLKFNLRCERKLGTGNMHSYVITVPPLLALQGLGETGRMAALRETVSRLVLDALERVKGVGAAQGGEGQGKAEARRGTNVDGGPAPPSG